MSDYTRPELETPPADLLIQQMRSVYAERNAIYKDSYHEVGAALLALFRGKIEITTNRDAAKFALLVSLMGKIGRYCAAGMEHDDSLLDAGVFTALLRTLGDPADVPCHAPDPIATAIAPGDMTHHRHNRLRAAASSVGVSAGEILDPAWDGIRTRLAETAGDEPMWDGIGPRPTRGPKTDAAR